MQTRRCFAAAFSICSEGLILHTCWQISMSGHDRSLTSAESRFNYAMRDCTVDLFTFARSLTQVPTFLLWQTNLAESALTGHGSRIASQRHCMQCESLDEANTQGTCRDVCWKGLVWTATVRGSVSLPRLSVPCASRGMANRIGTVSAIERRATARTTQSRTSVQ